MGKAKGSTLIGLVKSLRRTRKRALEMLPTRLHHYLSTRISTSQWYPEEDLAELMRAHVSLTPGSPGEGYEQLGVQSAHALMEGVYSGASEMRLADERTKALWKAMHDGGDLVIAARAPGMARYELRGFDHASPEWCAMMKGWLGEVQRQRGCTNVSVECAQCDVDGAECCAWVCRWT